jgi:hypothetical protein
MESLINVQSLTDFLNEKGFNDEICSACMSCFILFQF